LARAMFIFLMKSRDSKWILLCGLGRLACCLSVSPVVGTIIACVIGTLAGLTSALTSCDQELKTDSLTRGKYGDFKSMGLLLGGIVIGSVLGILARTHSWLSPSVNSIINEWSNDMVWIEMRLRCVCSTKGILLFKSQVRLKRADDFER